MYFTPETLKSGVFGVADHYLLSGDSMHRLLFPGWGKKPEEKSIRFNQDAWAVYSSFMQCYHLDLLGADKNLHLVELYGVI